MKVARFNVTLKDGEGGRYGMIVSLAVCADSAIMIEPQDGYTKITVDDTYLYINNNAGEAESLFDMLRSAADKLAGDEHPLNLDLVSRKKEGA